MDQISRRVAAGLVDIVICSAPFFILGPWYFLAAGQQSGATGLIAQAAVTLGLGCSLLLLACLTIFYGLRQEPTPGRRWLRLEYREDSFSAACRRVLPAGILILGAVLSGYYSLLLIYPAVILLTGRSIAEWASGQQLQPADQK